MKEANRALYKRIGESPDFFMARILNRRPWGKQSEILRSVRDRPRTAVRSCNGIGKTFIAASAILWFLYGHPRSIVLSTAPTWRQVEKMIWKEIRAAYRGARYVLGGTLMPKSPELHIVHDEWYAAGLSTNEPDRFQGFHEEHIFVVVDEAAGVGEGIFEAIEGVLTSKGARLLLLGNPTSIGGAFYDAFKDPGFSKIHVSAFDTPNFTAFGVTEDDIESGEWEAKIGGAELPFPKLITPSWAAGRIHSWGKGSIPYEARVKGNFPTQGDDTLIPLNWIELAMTRWSDLPSGGQPVEIGVDVARYGSDKTVIATRHGAKLLPLQVYAQKGLTETAGLVKLTADSEGTRAVKVDEIGIGGGVVDILEENRMDYTGVNVAAQASDPEKYANLRAELWWNLRERLDPDPSRNPDPIGLPPDDDLMGELAVVRYKINSRGQMQIESKEDMKKRLGKSPDRADAVVLAFAPGAPETRVLTGGALITSGFRGW